MFKYFILFTQVKNLLSKAFHFQVNCYLYIIILFIFNYFLHAANLVLDWTISLFVSSNKPGCHSVPDHCLGLKGFLSLGIGIDGMILKSKRHSNASFDIFCMFFVF